MRIPSNNLGRATAGSTLLVVMATLAVVGITIAATLRLSLYTDRMTHGRADWTEAFFEAENGLQWMAQVIADSGNSLSASNYYSTAGGTLGLDYLSSSNSLGRSVWVKAVRTNAALPNVFLVTSSARVQEKVRTIEAVITRNPPSTVFDYEYFLNNWGWWWGSSITGYGGNRANWDFDFRDKPIVNGVILASGTVNSNNKEWVPGDPVPFGGMAGADADTYVRSGVPRETMPNLKDFSYYEAQALDPATTNRLWVGSTLVVNGVHSDATQPGLYLEGTDSDPVKIEGTVVIPGDVVIQGKITGHGTLYVGGNLYVAGNLTYKNGPDWSAAPEVMTPAQRDLWVSNNKAKDLVVFAVRESILGGDVTSSDWKNKCFEPAGYGLKNVGNEAGLGSDGIAQTPDDNQPFDHHDGTEPSAWFDADGDGVVDGSYNYDTQITMTTARASGIANYPTNGTGKLKVYSSVGSNNMHLLDGVFYTNHAAAMRLAVANAIFHGALISRDEAIIFANSLKFYYDSRIHSRYNNDPNKLVDLDLPIAGKIGIGGFAEAAPDAANL